MAPFSWQARQPSVVAAGDGDVDAGRLELIGHEDARLGRPAVAGVDDHPQRQRAPERVDPIRRATMPSIPSEKATTAPTPAVAHEAPQ